ncbi:MAG: hypothetical protein R2813_08290 [Flavobacteriales bacterium]
MRKYAFFLASFSLCLVIATSSCKRGNTLGAVGYPDTTDFPVYDTFDFPTSKYFFYGRFDGQYLLWQDSLRSKWDTARKTPNGEDLWEDWDDYEENIYYNFTNIEVAKECGIDSTSSYLQNITYFIRPHDASERIEIYFYDCVDLKDTTSAFWPNNELSVFMKGANPFTDTAYMRNGVRVVYVDQNLDKWETKVGSGQLNDTYFRITEFVPRKLAIDTLDTFGLYIVGGEFEGKLYNNGREKEVLGAKFRARLIPVDPY